MPPLPIEDTGERSREQEEEITMISQPHHKTLMKEYVTQLGAQELLLSKVHVHVTTALFITQEHHHHLQHGNICGWYHARRSIPNGRKKRYKKARWQCDTGKQRTTG
jgi:hypothetical protein